MHVCAHVSTPKLLITSGVIWTPNDWLNKFYYFYAAAAISIVSRHGFRNEAQHRNQCNKSNYSAV